MYILNPVDINANTNLTQEFNFGSQEHSRDKHREIFTGINVDRHGGCERNYGCWGKHEEQFRSPFGDKNTSSQQKVDAYRNTSTAFDSRGKSFAKKNSAACAPSALRHTNNFSYGGFETASK